MTFEQLGKSLRACRQTASDWAFENAQNYFPGFFKNQKINSIKQMQGYIEETINAYNKWFNYSVPKENSFMFPTQDVEKILALHIKRIVSAGIVIKIDHIYLCSIL